MHVAIDATPLTEPQGGIRRYTVELAKALAATFPQDRYVLTSDQSYHSPLDTVAACVEPRRFWWSVGLPGWLRRERVDLFHGTDFAVPYWPSHPAVVTIHDLSPWRFGGSERVRQRTPWLMRFGLASMVITPSEAIRREVIDFLGVSPEEVVATPLAAADEFQPVDAPPPAKRYFLYIGAFHRRKNLTTAITAWQYLRTEGVEVELHVAGADDPGSMLPLDAPGFRYLGNVADARLPQLYSQAEALLYPSHYEGFGLPVLEAMQCGALVIASRDAALLELSGGTCLHADAADPQEWVEAMRFALSKPQDLRRRARERANLFSWTKTAVLTRSVYCKAMRRFHG